tara:strand:+ start:24 stop:371 length:348 start_codon:yes stop_codon:yes gene_type:complete
VINDFDLIFVAVSGGITNDGEPRSLLADRRAINVDNVIIGRPTARITRDLIHTLMNPNVKSIDLEAKIITLIQPEARIDCGGISVTGDPISTFPKPDLPGITSAIRIEPTILVFG